MQSAIIPKDTRLVKRQEFERIYNDAAYISGCLISIRYLLNEYPYNRLGYIAGKKKYPKSSTRNRIRRVMRHAYAQLRGNVKTGFDILIQAKRIEKETKCNEVISELIAVFKKAKILAI